MGEAILVAAVERDLAPRELQALGASAWIEVRADRYVASVEALRAHFGGSLLFTLRTAENGGRSELSADERREALRDAAASYDFVDLEPDDLDALTLDAIPAAQRVISCVVSGADVDLDARVGRVLAVPARLYRIVIQPRGYADTLQPLRLLKSLGRDDVIAFADGVLGMWTRVVAPHWGAPFVFGRIGGDVALDGEPSITQLQTDYGLPELTEFDEIFGIAGDPVFSSLSPRLHNAAFRAMGRRALYVPFQVPSFSDFWEGLISGHALDELGLPIRAICVVSPYKQAALPVADARTPMVQRAQSTNFFIREGDDWTADTTDPAGVMLSLFDRGVDVASLPVAVVGCGGSGRAIAAALQQAGAEVTLVNRGHERASLAVNLLHLPFVPLAEFVADRYALVVNATPVGRQGDHLGALEHLRHDAVVIDLVYGDRPTPFVAAARANGQITVDGKEILMRQAMSQFRLMTGQDMPEPMAREILRLPYETLMKTAAEVAGAQH
jgi:3-dehydroquinate dehydratase/shikimate dehydrogenase